MSLYPAEEYVQKVKRASQQMQLERLEQHRRFLETLIIHHNYWAKSKDDLDVARMHTQVVDLLQEASNVMELISHAYHQDDNNHS